MKITLDAGHTEGYNRGALQGYFEGTKMFYLAEYLKEELEKYGCDVVLTRNSIKDNPPLAARGKTAIDTGSDMFLSLHSNAFSGGAHGVVGFYSIKRPDSKKLLDKLGATVTAAMGSYYRGSQTKIGSNGDYYGVIRSSVASGNVKYVYILEHGFHTDPAECAWLSDNGNLQTLARSEAKTIAEYFGLADKSADLYYVQTGAYAKKSSAIEQLTRVRAAGFDAILKQGSGLYKVQVAAYKEYGKAEAMANRLKNAGFETYITRKGGTLVSEVAPQAPITAGSRVMVRKGAKTYTGGGLASFVYTTVYDVMQLKGDRAVISDGGVVIAAVNVKDLILK